MDTSLKVLYEFEYMHKDDVCTAVVAYSGNRVSVVNYTDSILDRAFGKAEQVGLLDILDLFEYRCVPKSRSNIKELLASVGLVGYNPIEIIRLTHGAMVDDKYWIRFSDERHLTWEDVDPLRKIREVCEKMNKG